MTSWASHFPMKTGHHLTCILLLIGASNSAYGTTVFHYSVGQGGGRDLPTIRDFGGAGNDGMADSTTRLNSNVPTVGLPLSVGNRSINGFGEGGVTSAGTAELSNAEIADARGFTMESWFFWNGGGTVNSIIDYAGTEKLVLDTSIGAGNEVRMRINSDSNFDSIVGSVEPSQWHYVAAVFDTQGNAVNAGSITGRFNLFLDGHLVDTTDSLTISDFGDSLNRAIGVAKHPLNFPLDRFDGLIFEPRVTLGALSASELLYVPEPSTLLLLICGTFSGIAVSVARRRKYV